MTNEFLLVFIIIPILGFLISFFIPEKKESWLSWTAFTTVFLQFIVLCVFIFYWIINGSKDMNLFELSIVKTNDFDFFIDFYFVRKKKCQQN